MFAALVDQAAQLLGSRCEAAPPAPESDDGVGASDGGDTPKPKAEEAATVAAPATEAVDVYEEETTTFGGTDDAVLVAVRLPHGHKFRARLWMERRFPAAMLRFNARDVLVFGLSPVSAGDAVVAALRGDPHARRYVHAATACSATPARSREELEAALCAAHGGGRAKLCCYGCPPGLKSDLLKTLPADLDLGPRGHGSCLTVEAVGGGFLVGVCAASREFASDPAVVAAKAARPDAVCRAFFKLREASDVWGLDAVLGGAVVDVGASPGGWSQVCLEAGARLVAAVDPGALDAALRAAYPTRLVHVNARVEACDLGVLETNFDAVVCDANAHPAAALRALEKTVLPFLKRGAALVLTLKQPSSANKRAGDLAEVRAVLDALHFVQPKDAWLWANGRKERTLHALYDPPESPLS